MNQEKTGGAAFPNEEIVSICGIETRMTNPGMNLLDYFAAKVVGGILANHELATFNAFNADYFKAIAGDSYGIAAAMLEERKKYMQ